MLTLYTSNVSHSLFAKRTFSTHCEKCGLFKPHLISYIQKPLIEKIWHNSSSIESKSRIMTIEEFNGLGEQQKKVAIFDADKITERILGIVKFELFKIDNFYIETQTCLENKSKRTIVTYKLKDLPVEYASEVIKLPQIMEEVKGKLVEMHKPVFPQLYSLW